MAEQRPSRGDRTSVTASVLLGVLLVAGGALLLVLQLTGFQLDFGFLAGIGWPAFVIIPGVVLLLVGLVSAGDTGKGLAVAGGVVSMVGLLLAYQSATDHWASWAYAWALVAPGGAGAALSLWSLLHRDNRSLRDGLGTLGVGLVLFLIGFAFFEGLIGIGGQRGLAPLADQLLPIALIVAGLLIIASRFWPWSQRNESALRQRQNQ